MIKVYTYRNKNNANKYIDVKHMPDGHYLWRQRMVWWAVNVENYVGKRKGGYTRVSKGTINEVLKDYTNVNWYGLPGAVFVYHGTWADPEVIYKGKCFDVHEVEDTLYEYFSETETDSRKFPEWVRNNADMAYELMDAVVEGK